MCAPFSRVKRPKCQIAGRLQIRPQQLCGNAMVNRFDEIELRQRRALIVRDRNKRRICEAGGKRMHLRKIEPSVQCGHERPAEPPQHRNVDPVQVVVNDVEFLGAARHTFEQGGKRRHRIDRRAAQPQRLGRYRNKLGLCVRAAACKQRNCFAQADQLVGHQENDAFSPAIMAGRYAFGERRNFCNMHSCSNKMTRTLH